VSLRLRGKNDVWTPESRQDTEKKLKPQKAEFMGAADDADFTKRKYKSKNVPFSFPLYFSASLRLLAPFLRLQNIS
jgi:hypothetical protein